MESKSLDEVILSKREEIAALDLIIASKKKQCVALDEIIDLKKRQIPTASDPSTEYFIKPTGTARLPTESKLQDVLHMEHLPS